MLMLMLSALLRNKLSQLKLSESVKIDPTVIYHTNYKYTIMRYQKSMDIIIAHDSLYFVSIECFFDCHISQIGYTVPSQGSQKVHT